MFIGVVRVSISTCMRALREAHECRGNCCALITPWSGRQHSARGSGTGDLCRRACADMGPPVGQALEFLSQTLSQRGPQAVPYAENVKWNIREHMSELLKGFPTLIMSVSEYQTNDGRRVVLNLLKAQGTVPIHFQGVKYNIPVIIWLPERYPMHAPLVYVTPTPNMVIKHNHSCVEPQGQVRTPYLSAWLYPSSDLSAMVQEMCMVFGAEPPLFSKPAGYTPPPPPPGQAHMQQNLAAAAASQQQQQQQQQGYPAMDFGGQQQPGRGAQQQQYPPPGAGGADAAGQALWGGAYAAASGARPTGGAGGGSGPSSGSFALLSAGSFALPGGGGAGGSPGRRQGELDDGFVALAGRALQGRLQAGLEAFNREAAREMDSLLEVQRQLMAREAELQRAVGSVQQDRAGTEGVVAELGARCRALEKWLEDNEWKSAALGGAAAPPAKGGRGAAAAAPSADAAAALLAKLDVNKVVVPEDDLSRQALAAQAEDLAVEDALTVLDRALQNGKLPADAYIKQSRGLCRTQFFARARGLKIAQLQQAAAVRAAPQGRGGGGPPGGGGGGGYPMVQGDGWSHTAPGAASFHQRGR
ncbi:MAG: UEV domain-containing protein, partial [Monoraphidium minutum]